MYGKIFARTFEHSMMGKGSHVFAVMGYIIAKTVDSQITLKPDYLAFVIGDTEERIREAIAFLSSPDPESTGKEHDGRRIVPIGDVPHEYFVPRHEHYRGIKTSNDTREATRERVRKFRQKEKEAAINAKVNKGDLMIKSIQNQKLAETIYDAYPRKVARPEAIKAILKALDKVSFEELLEKTKAFAIANAGQVEKFIPHPSTFYNQERYNDPIASASEQSMRTEIISCVYMKKIPEERRMEPTPIDVPVKFFSDGSPDLGSIPSDPIEIRMAVEDKLIALGRMV